MADKETVVHIGENSAEKIAYDLTMSIWRLEKENTMTRERLLDLYAECIDAVRGLRNWHAG